MEISRQSDSYSYRIAGWSLPTDTFDTEAAEARDVFRDEFGPGAPPSDEEYGPTQDPELQEGNGYYSDLDGFLADEAARNTEENDPYNGNGAAQLQDLIDAYEGPQPYDDEEQWAEARLGSAKDPAELHYSKGYSTGLRGSGNLDRAEDSYVKRHGNGYVDHWGRGYSDGSAERPHRYKDPEGWKAHQGNIKQAIGIGGGPLPGQGQAMSFKPKNYLPNWSPGEQPKRSVPGVNDESGYNFTGSPETQYHHRSTQPGQRDKFQDLQNSQDDIYELMRGGYSFDEAKQHLRIGNWNGDESITPHPNSPGDRMRMKVFPPEGDRQHWQSQTHWLGPEAEGGDGPGDYKQFGPLYKADDRGQAQAIAEQEQERMLSQPVVPPRTHYPV